MSKVENQRVVASEFGFDEDLVREVLRKNNFNSAGNLINFLLDLTDDEERKLIETSKCYKAEKEILRQSKKEKSERPAEENLRRETSKLYHASLCRKCFCQPRNILTLPCSHFCLCENCIRSTAECPICKERILTSFKAFLA